MAYKYITDNNLYERQTYMYSEYKGRAFIEEYIESRRNYLNCDYGGQDKVQSCINADGKPTRKALIELRNSMEAGRCDEDMIYLMQLYTKSFEVRKRVYGEYDNTWKPLKGSGFEDYENYLLLADCLLIAYQNTMCLKYLSCLLKVDDTILSVKDKIGMRSQGHLRHIIRQELYYFCQLAKQRGIGWGELDDFR